MSADTRARWAAATVLGLVLPFLGKPVHLDDANFLVLARGAALDPYRPHAVEINWQGTTERAFEVLSNPPGIGWWLMWVVDQPVWVQHLWMLPWLGLVLLGAGLLGQIVARRGPAAMVLLGAAPATTLAAGSLMPDLPLLGTTLLGMAAMFGRYPATGALIIGLGALFRYSALGLVPVVMVLGALSAAPQRKVAMALLCGGLCALPVGLLALHDLDAYGEVHLLAMSRFQSVSNDASSLFHKAGASLAMLGGALALPTLGSRVSRLRGLIAGSVFGILCVAMFEQRGWPALGTLLACAAGGATVEAARDARAAHPGRRAKALWAWLLMGFVFLLTLRFTAARYWLPFFAPAVLLPLKEAPARRVRLAVIVAPILSLLLAFDDAQLARTQQRLAVWAHSLRLADRPARFSGHWGWQHALEAREWRPLEEDTVVPVGTLLVRSRAAWSQEPAPACWRLLGRAQIRPRLPLPRVHTWGSAANIHAFMLAGDPPTPSFSPWSLSFDPWDEATAWIARSCAPGEAPSESLSTLADGPR